MPPPFYFVFVVLFLLLVFVAPSVGTLFIAALKLTGAIKPPGACARRLLSSSDP